MYKLLYILIVLCLASCRVQYVPVNSATHDSIYINKVQYDSIYKHDSVYIVDRGDTVYLYKYMYLHKYKMLRDTVRVSRIDSIQVPYPVERKLSRWSRIKQDVGGIAIGSICIAVLIMIAYLVVRSRRL